MAQPGAPSWAGPVHVAVELVNGEARVRLDADRGDLWWFTAAEAENLLKALLEVLPAADRTFPKITITEVDGPPSWAH